MVETTYIVRLVIEEDTFNNGTCRLDMREIDNREVARFTSEEEARSFAENLLPEDGLESVRRKAEAEQN